MKRSSYGYVKKFRKLRKLNRVLNHSSDSDDADPPAEDSQLPFNELCDRDSVNVTIDSPMELQSIGEIVVEQKEKTHNQVIVDYGDIEYESAAENSSTAGTSRSESPVVDQLQFKKTVMSLKDKLRQWALQNSGILRHSVISQLLLLLRSEGHVNLPKTASTLLGTQHCTPVLPMRGKSGNTGSFYYIGIEQGLKQRISPATYSEDTIRVFVNIDGVPLYKKSREQFWPILVQLNDTNYRTSSPFVVAIFSGDSKPSSADEYLKEFIEEASKLTENGIVIENKHYSFEVSAFICDTPARAFVKCVKGHTGFYACERCETKGVSVRAKSKKKSIKRVYPETDSKRRTKKSFRKKRQEGHHITNLISPLLKLPNFDIIKAVILDYMHLLCIGIMLALMEKWISRSSGSSIKPQNLEVLKQILIAMTSDVPIEFQRKAFDIDNISNWEATQYRFILLYCGALVLKDILPEKRYRHFLLLFVACRLLCSRENAVAQSDTARNLLIKFFVLMPSLYDEGSQTMNFHNLIHLADDVKYLNASLSEFSAFPFENKIGLLKKLIRTPNKPLAQVVNRLKEKESHEDLLIRRRPVISECIFTQSSARSTECHGIILREIRKITVKDLTLTSSHPNNVVKLSNGEIFQICRIMAKETPTSLRDVYFEGYPFVTGGNAFDAPCPSSDVGIVEVGALGSTSRKLDARELNRKCVLLNVRGKKYSITLLHT